MLQAVLYSLLLGLICSDFADELALRVFHLPLSIFKLLLPLPLLQLQFVQFFLVPLRFLMFPEFLLPQLIYFIPMLLVEDANALVEFLVQR